jgi:U3 small nucleolar RNA-associated protein 6
MSGGGSIKSARVLLQRGLRINNNAKALWLQSFCLELHYVQKMRGRREILQLQSDITENDDNVDNAEVENGLVIPQIVYKNAIKAIPDDTSFRLNFIEQCKLFPLTESLIEIIVETIENDFQNVEDVWITRAGFILEKEHACQSHASEENDSSTRKRKRIKKDNNQTCDSVLRKLMEAIETIKTPEMFRQVLSFLRLNISTLCNGHHNESTDDSLIVKQRMTSIIEFVVHVINEVQATVDIVPDLAIEMAESLVELGLLNQSFELMKNLTSNKTSCRTNPKCWLKLVELSESIGNEDDDIKTMNKSCAFMKMALKVIPLHDPGHVDILSKLFMTLLSKSTLPSHFDELSIVYDKILLLHVQKKNDPSTLAIISLAYLRYAKQKKDINFIRQLYSKLLLTSSVCKTPCVSLENAETMKKYFDECINAETSQLGKHTKMKKHFVTQIYDVASKYFSLVDDKSACYYNQKKREMSTS